MGLLFQTSYDNHISSYAIKTAEFGAGVPEIAPSFAGTFSLRRRLTCRSAGVGPGGQRYTGRV